MVRLAGSATVTLAARGRVFLPVDLAEESAYFLEETVFAFEESVVFENGRVPSRIAPDLHLVHLRGKGRVLLCVPTPARSVVITPGVGCAIPMAVLVGWHGSLTPKIVGRRGAGRGRDHARREHTSSYALMSAPSQP
jgi:uncharacterized protein (AIM24 family)